MRLRFEGFAEFPGGGFGGGPAWKLARMNTSWQHDGNAKSIVSSIVPGT